MKRAKQTDRRPRESGDPGRAFRRLPWTPAFAGATGKAFVIAAILALPVLASAQQASAPKADDAANGKRVYMVDGCFECHGTVGQGSRSTGGPELMRTQLPEDAFMQQLRQPSNDMPPYEPGVLSDKDAADIYAYLQSLPPAKQAKDIPLLNQ
jgi:mono/diheme cytochrome c family protein